MPTDILSETLPVSYNETVLGDPVNAQNVYDFLKYYRDRDVAWDFYLCPVKEDKQYTGYNAKLKKKQNIILSKNEINGLIAFGYIKPKHMTLYDPGHAKWNQYSIRAYKPKQKLFPLGFKAFRVSFCQYAVNFPPLTAKYLYERFTDHIPKDQHRVYIYDPSAGWGGRLLGAMAMNDKRAVTYIGTDPNTDHNTTPGRTKYHEIADFFNSHVRGNKLFDSAHNYAIFQDGSEVIGQNPDFQKYKGVLDLVFTSPPYFAKEVYSDDPEQSCHKFSTYETWKEGFLRPTLETAVEYLKSDRYLLWNIADAAFDGKLLTLEEDSCTILKDLGMEYVTTLKMALAQMPGSNRMEETGDEELIVSNTVFGEETESRKLLKGKMKNFCQIQSGSKTLMLKYEPVFVFRKP
jgi:DNA methylase